MKATRICSISDCHLAVVSRGWCQKHYTRWVRYGDPLQLSFAKGRTSEQRFWQHVDRSGGPHSCWLWTGGLLNNGYGSFRVNNKSWPAHRWLWVQNHGPIADGLVVRHKCDVPACVNPLHHELGTPADNSADCVRRGRSTTGSKNGYAKLDEPLVREIKIALKAGHQQLAIARHYNVTPGCINHIATGRSWKHVVL